MRARKQGDPTQPSSAGSGLFPARDQPRSALRYFVFDATPDGPVSVAGWMVIDRFAVPCWLAASVTCTWNANVLGFIDPVALGVPEINPSRLNCSPSGKLPEATTPV